MEPIVAAARSVFEELSQALAVRDPHDVRLALAKLAGLVEWLECSLAD